MVVFTVVAIRLVQLQVISHEEIGGGERSVGSDASDFVELTVEGVVELEADGGIVLSEHGGRLHA